MSQIQLTGVVYASPFDIVLSIDERWHRILDSGPSKEKWAYKIVSFILYAKRPLTLLELQCALSKTTSGRLKSSDINKETIDQVCCGLVTIDRESTSVRFARKLPCVIMCIADRSFHQISQHKNSLKGVNMIGPSSE